MPAQDKKENFIRLLTESQNRLYGYIYTLIGDHSRAKDVLQEANLVLWRKYDELEKIENFKAWSFTVCRFQVMAYLRDKKRDRLLLDPELAEMMSESAEMENTLMSEAQPLLRKCIAELPEQNRSMIEMKYFGKMMMQDIAEKLKRSLTAVKVSIHRTRKVLQDCIRNKMLEEAE
ncbi:MAG: sigma-70 family RNA polymerase sigma factor [Lentisphaeraceae bacterium]|nr:sigma-70 family RNA polymerase sigma factor [Lentisphaeraceae bacterium]